jgi:hypothetical protein
MKLSVTKFFEQYGIISEMNDWKSHFLAGTKGQPKTEPAILDYVQDLLDSIFEDKEKVRNNKLAPWLVAQVKGLGINNIGTDGRNTLLNIIDWTREINNVANIPKLSLEKAHEYVISAREKKSKEKQITTGKSPSSETPEMQDEKDGKIKRVWAPRDGSGRIWVKVLSKDWLNSVCQKAEGHWGVGCQVGSTHGWHPDTYNIYTLIGPDKGNPTGPKSTIVTMGVTKDTKAVSEWRQEGNQMPGIQATSGGWSDADEQSVDFIANSPEARQNILKFFNYQQNNDVNIQKDSERNPYSGGAQVLWNIMFNKGDLFNNLILSRPELKEENKNIILSNIKFGQKWYETFGIDLEKYAQENPLKFIQNIESYEFLGSKLGEVLEKINIDKIAASHPKLVISKIEKLLSSLSLEVFKKLMATIDLPQYIKTSFDKFKDLIKMMANHKNFKFKELMTEIVSQNIGAIMEASGGGIKGLYNFLDFAAMPRMHRFSKKENGQVYAMRRDTKVDRLTGDRTTTEVEFPITEDLSILPIKERRKIIENNKEAIKSLYTGTEEEKEIKYLRVLFKEINPQDVERTLKAEKDKFINFYDKNPNKYTGYPGILEFYAVINKNKPGYTDVIATHGDANRVYYKMDSDDLRNKNVQKKLIGYFYGKSTATDISIKRYDAALDFLRTMKASNESAESIKEIATKEFSPKHVIGNNPTSVDYSLFMNVMSKVLSLPELKKFLESYKDEITASGLMGGQAYKDMLDKYSEKGYNVKVGDMVLYNKKLDIEKYSSSDDEGIFLTRGKKYKVTNTEDGKGIKNDKIEVLDDRKQNAWYDSRHFDLKIVNLNESVRKYVRKKILEAYKKKLDENESQNIKYSAVVLDDDSRDKLLSNFKIPADWETIAHHMTIKMGGLTDKALIGKEFNLQVTHIAHNDMVMAVMVDTDAPSMNVIKHITLAVNRVAGGKPVMSNRLSNWEPVDMPFVIKGVVTEVA